MGGLVRACCGSSCSAGSSPGRRRDRRERGQAAHGGPGRPGADDVVLVGIFGPLDFASTARGFRGGTVETWFGGGDIDLRGAVLDPGGADLRLRAVFGGGQIVVPDRGGSSIAMRGLGGVGDTRIGRRPAGRRRPELRIDATVLFGGFGITSDAPERDDDPGGAALGRGIRAAVLSAAPARN